MTDARARWWRRLPTLVAIVPLLAAALRALVTSWYPIGDNAFFTLRARDVLTEHHPLLGTWTSASLTVGTRINNPGPLLFDVLAAPAKIDAVAGTVVGVVALHVASVVLGVHWARRIAGTEGAWAVAGAFVALEWAMGSEILVEPWQPHSLLLPFLTFLVLVWALVAGEARALPWAVGVASLLVETHLSYALLVPGLGLLGLGVLLGTTIRAEGGLGAWAALRRPAVIALLVLGVAWLQPVIEQVTGDGNLATVITEGGSGGTPAGPRFAGRVLASVGAVPGGWGPGGFEGLDVYLRDGATGDQRALFPGLADAGTTVPWATVAVVLFAAACVSAWQRRDRALRSGLLVGVGAMALAFVTVALLPVSEVLGVAAHQLRPVWPVVLFATAVAGLALVRAWPMVAPVLGGAVLVVLVLALPAHNPRTGPSADAWAIPIVRDLVDQLDAFEAPGLVFVDLSVIRFAEPYSTPVMLELQRRGIEFVVDEASAAQLGLSREREADDPVTLLLRVVDGNAALRPAAGWDRVAFVAGLDAAEQEELDALTAERAARGALRSEDELRRRDLDHRRLFESAAVLVQPVLSVGSG